MNPRRRGPWPSRALALVFIGFVAAINLELFRSVNREGEHRAPVVEPETPSGCRIPQLRHLGNWSGETGCATGFVAVGTHCRFEPRDGVLCGADRYEVKCGKTGYLTRRPWCWPTGEFVEEDRLWGRHATVETDREMMEWRERVLKPEVPDGAFLRARCEHQNTSGAGAAARALSPPLLVHFISGTGDRFSFATMLHVLAVFEAFGAARAFVHATGSVESGHFWWNRLQNHPRVTFREIQEVYTVFGHPLTSHAHRADIIRLEVLLEFGGVYLDTDVLALRTIHHLLATPGRIAMAVERPAGLINAMIISPAPNADFLARWYRMYRQGPGCWNCVSIVWAPRLAFAHPCDATVLPTRALLVKGQYSPQGHARVFDQHDYDFSEMFAVHLFNNAGGARFKSVVPDELLQDAPDRLNNTYANMLRHALGAARLNAIARRFAGCAALADAPCGSRDGNLLEIRGEQRRPPPSPG